MSARTTIKQVGFVVQPMQHEAHNTPLAPIIPRYEPLYILSYGLAGTPASQGHWCIAMADPINNSGDALTFSLFGVCRMVKRPETPNVQSTSSKRPKIKRRVTIDPSYRELTAPEIQRQCTFPVGSLTRTQSALRWTPQNIGGEVTQIALRSDGPSIEYTLKHSRCLSDCLPIFASMEEDAINEQWPTYNFEEGAMKVLGVVEIAQLPYNMDAATKLRAWSKIDFDLKFGLMKGMELDELRRQCVVRFVKVVTEKWDIVPRDLPVGVSPSVNQFAKLLDLAPAKL